MMSVRLDVVALATVVLAGCAGIREAQTAPTPSTHSLSDQDQVRAASCPGQPTVGMRDFALCERAQRDRAYGVEDVLKP